MTMQTLVIAHAAFGHNHFFKNNYLFKQWTDAEGILDYLELRQELHRRVRGALRPRRGRAHARRRARAHVAGRPPLSRPQASSTCARRRSASASGARTRSACYNDLWRTVPGAPGKSASELSIDAAPRRCSGCRRRTSSTSSRSRRRALKPWQRELLRIVRHIAQYFYPQRQTKVMNEGCATFVHYRIMNRLHEQGRITDGDFLEFLHSHTNVVFQPDFDDPRFSGINPYALGFAMMQDIERIVREPDDEDREWFPDIAGNGDVMAVLREIWANYRDESFISQFLSPRLMRKMRHVPRRTTTPPREPASGSRRSTTSAAIGASAASCRANTTSAGSIPTSRWSTSISPATAACCCATRW